jgi:putative transposase
MRAKDGESEMPVRTYEHFASRDQLSRVVLERMLAGVFTRRYRRLQEPVGEEVETTAGSTSKSAVSRTFVARTKEKLFELMSRRLDDVRLAVLMIDGIVLKDHACVVALGIMTDGVKIPLGLWEGSTENKTVSSELLSNLVHRGLDVEQGVLVVIDGSKALRKAIRKVFGERVPVQRCIVTRSEMCSITCLSATARSSTAGCAEPGPRPTTTGRWSSYRPSPPSRSAPTPAPPRRCAKG